MTVDQPERLVVYGDFNCPFSALASARVATLEGRGLAEVDWRGVVHDPSIAVGGEVVTPSRHDDFERELDQVRGLLRAGEPDRLRVPRMRANTRLATESYAASGSDERSEVRERLFAAYWSAGLDVNDADVVEAIARDRRDEATAARWQEEWHALPQPIVPVMVLPDGYVSRGLGALARLARLIDDPPAADG